MPLVGCTWDWSDVDCALSRHACGCGCGQVIRYSRDLFCFEPVCFVCRSIPAAVSALVQYDGSVTHWCDMLRCDHGVFVNFLVCIYVSIYRGDPMVDGLPPFGSWLTPVGVDLAP